MNFVDALRAMSSSISQLIDRNIDWAIFGLGLKSNDVVVFFLLGSN